MKFMKHESLKSRTFPGFGGTAPFGAVWPKIELQGTILIFYFFFSISVLWPLVFMSVCVVVVCVYFFVGLQIFWCGFL